MSYKINGGFEELMEVLFKMSTLSSCNDDELTKETRDPVFSNILEPKT